ncbi:TRAFAC clade GTPase domain-containing protein [Streptomyces sp. P6-2-1]|uniref:TRAFAC clade GTPase domain-containing protein n=1 Tax=Streptomyces sp. P6-2-1 TaxID=3422591 RepID=UPI003D3653A9
MTTVICPYCFERSPAARLPFRCLMKTTGVLGKAPCHPVRDDAWADFMGSSAAPAQRERGPVFLAPRPLASLGSGPGRAACPDCGVVSTLRVCRRCHSDLPSDYCDQDTRIIALVGPKAAGKSTYVQVLVNELRHRVGRAYDASVVPMGAETQRRDREAAEDLYERLRLPQATRPAATGFNQPLLYRLSLPRPRRPGSTLHTALVFFDAAGEDLADDDATRRYTSYLASADGIILLVDPLQLGTVRDLVPPADGPLPISETPAQQIASNIAEQLRAHRGRRTGGRLATPVAVALTKTDRLRELVPPHSLLLRNASHEDGNYRESERRSVHEEVRGLLEGWDSGALYRQLNHDFAEVSLFGLSSLGAPPPPHAPSDVPPSGPQPLRVEDPLLWLLSRRGLLPRAREGRNRREVPA